MAKYSIPCTELLDGNHLIQLNCIPTLAGKQQFATLLLIYLSAYMRLRFSHASSEDIRLVVMLDEAHNLLQGVDDGQGNAYSFAEDFKGLLLELRSLGVAFIVSNQSNQGIPKLIPDVCGSKVFLGGSVVSGIKDYAVEMHLNEKTFRYLYTCKAGSGLYYNAEMPCAMFFQTANIIDLFDMKTPYATRNSFLEANSQFCVEVYNECSICPSKGTCTIASKQEAYRIASLLNMRFGARLEAALSVKDEKSVSKTCGALMVEICMVLLAETKNNPQKEQVQHCSLVQFARQYNRNYSVITNVEAILGSCEDRLKLLEKNV